MLASAAAAPGVCVYIYTLICPVVSCSAGAAHGIRRRRKCPCRGAAGEGPPRQASQRSWAQRRDSSPPRLESPAQPGFSLRPDMDFREILLIASKGQGVNHVPVSLRACSRNPGRQVRICRVELLGERLSVSKLGLRPLLEFIRGC